MSEELEEPTPWLSLAEVLAVLCGLPRDVRAALRLVLPAPLRVALCTGLSVGAVVALLYFAPPLECRVPPSHARRHRSDRAAECECVVERR